MVALRILVDPRNPPIDALIVAEILKSQKKVDVNVEWCKEWKASGNIQLLNEDNQLLGGRNNEVGRYFARAIDPELYGGSNPRERTEVDHWVSFAIGPLGSLKSPKESGLAYLNKVLTTNTWLVAKKLTLADIYIFSVLLEKQFLERYDKQYPNVTRWYKQILSLPAVAAVLTSVSKNRIFVPVSNDVECKQPANKQVGTRKQEGKFIELPGAEMGKVVVRFPPEASGYLHIGHAKAALLNQYYAEAFQGQLIMRFDDTNPAKEDVQFEEAILEDLKLLQIKPDRFTHSSDYFDVMLDYCTKLIKDGKAFVDDTPAIVMKEQRDQRLKSSNRDNSIEKNLQLWQEMQKGTAKGQECCVRAKIDYESVNGCLRDPTIYRCKPEPHPRTGTKYKVYPTYDFACPIVDAIENVTHTLRTTEYHDRDAQFYWLVDALGLRRPYIWEYSRLNMTNTVLSKRKLTWFVQENLVDGWDDPRFPTVRGILRRGMTVEGLKQFIIAQGSSRSVVFMEWDKIWAFNKKVIDPIAIRYTALDRVKAVPVRVSDAKEEWLTVQNHPKDPSIGTKRIKVCPTILIEKEDAEALVEGQNATFINWGNLLIEKIHKSNGTVEKVEARLNLGDKNYKNTLKLTWLAESSSVEISSDDLIPCYTVYFDHIINKAILGKDDDFKDFVARNTRSEIEMLGETELRRVKKGEIIQLQRKGFFRCDVPYAPASPYSSREQPLILFHIPDGHTSSPANVPSNVASAATNDSRKTVSEPSVQSADEINEKIVMQGDKVRRLKTEKADKATVNAEVKILLALKADYKNVTGDDWKPGASPKKSAQPENESAKLSNEIVQRDNKIRELQELLCREINQLSSLKIEYKEKTGKDWPGDERGSEKVTETAGESTAADEISDKIQKQGDKVRQLKSAKAAKNKVDEEVKILLSLKADYKAATGQDWKPKAEPAPSASTVKDKQLNPEKISHEIQKQGDKVRQLKSSKAEKNKIDEEVKILLSLKADYKSATGEDWKPKSEPKTTKPEPKTESKPKPAPPKAASPVKSQEKEAPYADKIAREIQKQHDRVQELRNSTPIDTETVAKEERIFLSLKNDYRTVTGKEWKSSKPSESPKKKKKEDSPKSERPSGKEINKAASKEVDSGKTGTRLGLEAKKEENFFDWYSQVITKSGMIEYYDVSGCYILRPWSFAIWKIIKEYIDRDITQAGVQECYFPIFVTRAVLEKEKTHIADFAPEVAWVTKCGDSDMAEPIAIRPTSETVMYPAYAKWLRSDTELPLKLNQWNNVVRWEFKDPKPFLRTREFLWQEGHTAFATKAEADEEVLKILDMYARVYEDLLAVPVVKGRKTEKEKFAGGDYTTTVEAFISVSGRAIQGATSHHLGQNFSKMFSIQVEGVEGDEKTYVYQNSWGLTTRTIGVMIMVHGDDKGLVLPPNIAALQAVIVPCGITASTTAEQKDLLMQECEKLMNELSADKNLRIKADYRNNRTPGWKFNHWELKGVPVRVELGPKDLEKNQVTFVRRDNFQRVTSKRDDVLRSLRELLVEIQSSLLANARKSLEEHIKQVENWEEFCAKLNQKNLILAPFCGDTLCEDSIKADSAREDQGEEPGALSMGAKGLCIPFQQPKPPKPLDSMKCIHPNCQKKPKFYTLFGRSY